MYMQHTRTSALNMHIQCYIAAMTKYQLLAHLSYTQCKSAQLIFQPVQLALSSRTNNFNHISQMLYSPQTNFHKLPYTYLDSSACTDAQNWLHVHVHVCACTIEFTCNRLRIGHHNPVFPPASFSTVAPPLPPPPPPCLHCQLMQEENQMIWSQTPPRPRSPTKSYYQPGENPAYTYINYVICSPHESPACLGHTGQFNWGVFPLGGSGEPLRQKHMLRQDSVTANNIERVAGSLLWSI